MYNPTNEEFPNIQVCVVDFNDGYNSRYELWVYHDEPLPVFHLINEKDQNENYTISFIEPICYNRKHIFNPTRLSLLNTILKTEMYNATIYQHIVSNWRIINSGNPIKLDSLTQPDYTALY